jgi:hypothetical protein
LTDRGRVSWLLLARAVAGREADSVALAYINGCSHPCACELKADRKAVRRSRGELNPTFKLIEGAAKLEIQLLTTIRDARTLHLEIRTRGVPD